MQEELKFPVFAFQKNDNMIYVFFKERDLKSTSERFLDKSGFVGDTIVDITGNKFKIDKAFKVKYLGLWGFNPLLKGRQILVDFEYAPEVEKVLLSDFKKDIIHRIDKTKKNWKFGWDISELKEVVTNSSSFEEIANLLK